MTKYKVWRVENEENGKMAKYGTKSLCRSRKWEGHYVECSIVDYEHGKR